MYQHVKFYSEDGKNKSVECVFRSEKTFELFLSIAKTYLSYNVYAWDILDENEKNIFHLAVIPANVTGLKRIYSLLYPNLSF